MLMNFKILRSAFFFEKQIKDCGLGSRNGFYIKLYGSVSIRIRVYTDPCLEFSIVRIRPDSESFGIKFQF